MSRYQHKYSDNSVLAFPPGKIVCVGRNYSAHIAELNNALPAAPLIFMKPVTAYAAIEEPIELPHYSADCQHEVEIAVLIGKTLKNADYTEIQAAISGYGIALDLTLRDVQQELKQQAYPWELAKAFDKSCPISAFIPAEKITDPNNIVFSLTVNDQLRQQGCCQDMIISIVPLIGYISQYFTLLPGDVVLTGTPSGVDTLRADDKLILKLNDYRFEASVN